VPEAPRLTQRGEEGRRGEQGARAPRVKQAGPRMPRRKDEPVQGQVVERRRSDGHAEPDPGATLDAAARSALPPQALCQELPGRAEATRR
jgi:hypothetical protein